MTIVHTSALERAIDAHVGHDRARRHFLGQSQPQLAQAVSRSHQQIGKFQAGVNRVPGSLLYRLAKAQQVEVGFYFEGFVGPAGR